MSEMFQALHPPKSCIYFTYKANRCADLLNAYCIFSCHDATVMWHMPIYIYIYFSSVLKWICSRRSVLCKSVCLYLQRMGGATFCLFPCSCPKLCNRTAWPQTHHCPWMDELLIRRNFLKYNWFFLQNNQIVLTQAIHGKNFWVWIYIRQCFELIWIVQ